MLSDGDRAVGCIFCITGKEKTVAENIQRVCADVRTTVARCEKYQTCKGKKTKVEGVLLPSYVFFEAPSELEIVANFPTESILRILKTDQMDWRLTGEDEKFVRWLFSYDGLLSFSKAYQEGNRIRIISGPMKDLEGQVCKIDKRGNSGQVRLRFQNREVKVWLNFELVTPFGTGDS